MGWLIPSLVSKQPGLWTTPIPPVRPDPAGLFILRQPLVRLIA